jgi:hypothetical protein
MHMNINRDYLLNVVSKNRYSHMWMRLDGLTKITIYNPFI